MSEFPRYRPIQQFVIDELSLKRNLVYTSRLNAWIRVTANAGSGLVLQSNPNIELVGSTSVYGNESSPGIVGLNWAGESVKVSGDDRGLRPSPTISGLSIKNGTSGLTRECNFSIEAYTPGQVDVIQLYFGQPGFTSVVEFGWDLEKAHNQTLDLNASSISKLNNFKNVLDKRKKSKGNYDNFFGFITGFKIGSEGDKYTIDVTLKGLGELPQTLKLHKPIEDDTPKVENESGRTKTVSRSSLKYSPQSFRNTNLDTGIKNFMYMFNSLPSHKQIQSVKDLESEYGRVENFINFNDVTKESIQEETEGSDGGGDTLDMDGVTVKIPKGTKLVGDERFIRFGLLKKIIDTNDVIDPTKIIQFDDGKSYPSKIFTEFTVCNAFNRIFSTAKDRVVVPNKNCPDFGVLKALKGEESNFETGNNDCSQKTENNPISNNDGVFGRATREFVEFPQSTGLDEPKSNGFEGIERSSRTWGYIDDLYINFDFAVSVIEAENLSYADVILELVNGMSTGVNSLWDFQIMEKVAPVTIPGQVEKGDLCLQIVEMNCTTERQQTSRNLIHNGEGSFFINGTLDIDLPGDMMNSIISDRKKFDAGTSVDVGPEGSDAGGFPLNSPEIIRDSVLDILNDDARKSVQSKEEKDSSNPIEDESEVDSEEDIIAALYNSILEKVGTYPNRKDGKFNMDDTLWQRVFDAGETVGAEEVLFHPTFNDQALFKKFLSEDNPNLDTSNEKEKKPKGAGTLISMLKYNFEIHGNSGIAHGDNFNIIGIPSVYSKSGFFQVTNVEHNIDGMNWTTSIEGQYRSGATSISSGDEEEEEEADE